MTKQQLITKLQDIEWEDFEVKEASGGVPKSSWETVSAFSNTAGGWLVFGVLKASDYTVTGIKDAEKTEQDFKCNPGDKFNKRISVKCKKYRIENKTVLAFLYPVCSERPAEFILIQNQILS